MSTEMRQCANNLTVVGTLKSKKVTYGSNGNGDNTISVELVVASNDSDKVHENTIKLWAKQSSKLYASYKTVADEYKTIDENGAAEASRVKLTGSLEMNEYFNKNKGELSTYNNLRGVFANRLDKEMKDEVGAVVECVITGISDEVDKTGAMTGRKKVQVLTVGYGPTIHELQNVIVEKELAAQFQQMYPINSTGKLYLKVLNYAEIDEAAEALAAATPTVGFGTTLSNMPDSVVKNYVNEIIVVGGDTPNVANRFTVEQIAEMKKQRELSAQEKLNSAPATPPAAPSGFGSGFGTGASTDTGGFGGPPDKTPVDDGDMPF